MVRVRGWIIHQIYESSHKDRSTGVCACVCLHNSDIRQEMADPKL